MKVCILETASRPDIATYCLSMQFQPAKLVSTAHGDELWCSAAFGFTAFPWQPIPRFQSRILQGWGVQALNVALLSGAK
jgi:hypothetical protein